MLPRALLRVALASALVVGCARSDGSDRGSDTVGRGGEPVALPAPTVGAVALDDALARRRSVRSFSSQEISTAELGQLCWAAQGITERDGSGRAAPSAGALYPLELYVVLPAGLFHYEPREHRMRQLDAVDHRAALARAALDQDAVSNAGADLVLTAVVARTRAKYGDRTERFVAMEAGHAAQNVLLEATAMGLGAVPIGGFDDGDVRKVLGVGGDELPLYVIATGHPR